MARTGVLRRKVNLITFERTVLCKSTKVVIIEYIDDII